MTLSPMRRIGGALSLAVLFFCTPLARASSHREALAILNEPCADNTDTYAWVSNATHGRPAAMASARNSGNARTPGTAT